MRNSNECMRSVTASINFTTMKAECWMFQCGEAVARWADSIPTTLPRIDGVLWFIQDIFRQFGDLADLIICDLDKDEIKELRDLSAELELPNKFICFIDETSENPKLIVDVAGQN